MHEEMKHGKNAAARLEEIRDEYTEMSIPESLDNYITYGIHKAKRRKKRLYAQIGTAAACLLLIVTFVTSVRVSTAFAAFVGNIPGMSSIVKLIQHDRGLNLALDNDFIQPIGLSDEHDDIRVTLDGIIMDEVRLNAFYTIEFLDAKQATNPTRNWVSFENSSFPDIGYVSSGPDIEDTDNPQVRHGGIDIQFVNESGAFPDRAIFHTKFPGYDTEWQIPFEIDVEKFKGLKESYMLNEIVEVEGQKFTIVEAVIYPTRITVKIQPDPHNTKKILGYRDLQIVNEKGEVITSPSATGPDRNGEYIAHFESSYFAMPKSLSIEGSLLSALDHDRTDFILDPVKGEIVQSPDDRVRLVGIDRGSSTLNIHLELNDMDPSDRMAYGIVGGEFRDASGQIYRVGSSRTTSIESERLQKIEFEIPNEAYEGNLTFPILTYPSFIEQPFRIRVK